MQAMTISALLRLIPSELARGRVAGRVVLVETGDQVVVRSVQELVEVLSTYAVEHGNQSAEGVSEAGELPDTR